MQQTEQGSAVLELLAIEGRQGVKAMRQVRVQNTTSACDKREGHNTSVENCNTAACQVVRAYTAGSRADAIVNVRFAR